MIVANVPQQEKVVLDINVKLDRRLWRRRGGRQRSLWAWPPASSKLLVTGDDDNDRLGLFADLSQLLQSTLVLDGGPGFDLCSATENVLVMNCECSVGQLP